MYPTTVCEFCRRDDNYSNEFTASRPLYFLSNSFINCSHVNTRIFFSIHLYQCIADLSIHTCDLNLILSESSIDLKILFDTGNPSHQVAPVENWQVNFSQDIFHFIKPKIPLSKHVTNLVSISCLKVHILSTSSTVCFLLYTFSHPFTLRIYSTNSLKSAVFSLLLMIKVSNLFSVICNLSWFTLSLSFKPKTVFSNPFYLASERGLAFYLQLNTKLIFII